MTSDGKPINSKSKRRNERNVIVSFILNSCHDVVSGFRAFFRGGSYFWMALAFVVAAGVQYIVDGYEVSLYGVLFPPGTSMPDINGCVWGGATLLGSVGALLPSFPIFVKSRLLRPRSASLGMVFMLTLALVLTCLAVVVWAGGPSQVFSMDSDNTTDQNVAAITPTAAAIKLVFYGIFSFLFQASKALFFAETAHVI